MAYTSDIQARTVKWSLAAMAILAAPAFLFLKNPLAFLYGLVFGGLIGILNFLELARTLERAVAMPVARAKSYTAVKYFLRYIIMALVLFVSVKADYINIIGTILGLLLVKFVVLATNLFDDRRFYQNILKRKGDE